MAHNPVCHLLALIRCRPPKDCSLGVKRSPNQTQVRTMNWIIQKILTEGNLEIMRGMNSESVDLIYLDPQCYKSLQTQTYNSQKSDT